MDYKLIKIRRKILADKKVFLLPVGLTHYLDEPIYKNSKIILSNGLYYLGNDDNRFIVHPNFHVKKNIGGKKYYFFNVIKDKDKIDCQNLILYEHYLKPPNRGMYFACSNGANIIGCCIIDELSYGNPKGRMNLSPSMTAENGWSNENWRSLNRAEVRKKLNVCWLSRIAVKKSYHKKGIGAEMLNLIVSMLNNYHPLKPNYLEVIATYTKEGKNIFDENNNVFCRSNFKYILLSKYTHDVLDSSTGLYVPKPARRYYFWTEIS